MVQRRRIEPVRQTAIRGMTWQHIRFPVAENPVYWVVGIVNGHFGFCEPGAESRAARETGVDRPTLDAAHSAETRGPWVLYLRLRVAGTNPILYGSNRATVAPERARRFFRGCIVH